MNLPFRAEHVGSLLRPEALRRAHRDLVAGRIGEDEFHAAQDRAIADAVQMQESLGFRAVTDGEFRRLSYWAHFVDAVEGLALGPANFAFRDREGNEIPFIGPRIVGPLKRRRGISTGEFAFLASVASAMPKITMPSPATFLFWLGGATESSAALAAIYRDEIADLYRLGCRYIQLDDVPFAMLCDPRIRANFRDPDRMVANYIALTNDCLARRPRDMAVGFHICRGNFKGAFLSEGGYDAVAAAIFGGLAVDGYFLEYDTDRAGDFTPLRHVPAGKTVILGLVSSKTAALEERPALRARIAEAARLVPLERLGLSPQCGFASAVTGNPVTEADQRAKLRLVAETAREVWGDG